VLSSQRMENSPQFPSGKLSTERGQLQAYNRLNDQPLSVVPLLPQHQPDRDRLAWHYNNCYQA